MSEFPDKAPAREVGDPALDPPMTVRVERWADRKRTDVRRAVKSDMSGGHRWSILVGEIGRGGRWLSDDDVRAWPVCPDVVTQTAYALAAGRITAGGGERQDKRGDLDVTVFKGEQ